MTGGFSYQYEYRGDFLRRLSPSGTNKSLSGLVIEFSLASIRDMRRPAEFERKKRTMPAPTRHREPSSEIYERRGRW